MIGRLLISCLLTLSLISPTIASTYITVEDDNGGEVSAHIKWYKRIQQSGIPVHVQGLCLSACTLVLMLPQEQVCIEPSAALGFHLAMRLENDEFKPNPEYSDRMFRRYYPPMLYKWIKENVTGANDNEPVWLSAEELIKMGAMRACS